jgi:hypothetical protein
MLKGLAGNSPNSESVPAEITSHRAAKAGTATAIEARISNCKNVCVSMREF